MLGDVGTPSLPHNGVVGGGGCGRGAAPDAGGGVPGAGDAQGAAGPGAARHGEELHRRQAGGGRDDVWAACACVAVGAGGGGQSAKGRVLKAEC